VTDKLTKPVLGAGFRVGDLPGEWFITCTVCLQAWVVTKGAPLSTSRPLHPHRAHPQPACHELREVIGR
jgi:hypothetical protein